MPLVEKRVFLAAKRLENGGDLAAAAELYSKAGRTTIAEIDGPQ
jgi:hypothetical protein